MDNNGTRTSAIITRHDYLPFGEEVFADVGLRTTTQKYSVTDKARQRFALTERDEATGLDHTWFRNYDSFAGRWTSPDALSGGIADPQSFNHYVYAANDPVNLMDSSGLDPDIDIGTFYAGDVVAQPGMVGTLGFDGEAGVVITPTKPEMPEPQEPVPQPHPSPTPQPSKPSNFFKCFNGWKFSATVDHFTRGTRLNGAATVTAQALEIAPPASLAGDIGATTLKSTRTGIAGTTNPYASGLNLFFRRVAPSSIKGSLIKFGTKATPILSAVGAFTAGYNFSMAVQCHVGIIE